jgi:putative membrane protein
MEWIKNERLTKRIILIVSLAIPVVVTALRYIPHPDFSEETKAALYNLPKLNAFLNGSAFLLLIGAIVAIKNKNVALHQRFTTGAVVLSAVFLVSYVIFHYTCAETSYGGEGSIKTLYYIILITHVLLSAVIVPLALLAWTHGFSKRIEQHRRIVKIAYPMWLYVTLTGVLVYLMIEPFYPY